MLHQPSISQAWKELDTELYGHLSRNQQPMLEWDAKSTGHAQGFLEGESPGKLQDLLEFFCDGRDDAKFLARLAHDAATIRVRDEMPSATTPTPTPSSSRPSSEPLKREPGLKASPLMKHLSTPQPPLPSPPTYDSQPMLKKQRSLAPLPPLFSKNPFFDQAPPQLEQQLEQQPQPHTPQSVMSPFMTPPMTQPMMGTAPGGYYDLAVTHVHPHMQLMSQMPPQQHQQHQQLQPPQHQHQPQPTHLMSPMNVYDDWSSIAGTVVDESVFANTMTMSWQPGPDMGRGHGQ